MFFLSCQDKKEIESEIFQPSINWDLNNIGAIDINEDDLKSSLEKIIYFDDLRSIGIIYNNQFIFEHYNIGDTTSKFPVYSITKSVLSAIFGQLIDQKIIEDEYDKIDKYLDLFSIKDPEIKTCTTFEETFKKAFDDENYKIIIPIENSLAGRVADIHYLLPKYKLQIHGEYFLNVEHNLLCKPEAKIEDIKYVRSHAQAIGQCQNLINKKKIPVYNFCRYGWISKRFSKRK